MLNPIILDMDPGIDDAVALMLAARSPELNLRAVTTVSGNVHVDKTSVNALKVLEVLGEKSIPVAKGMTKPLRRQLEVAEDWHGKDGLGDSNLPPPTLQLDRRHAVDLLIEEVTAHPKTITVVATAPLTNIATAILREPKFAQDVRELVVMGGAFGVTRYGYGNVTPAAEYNAYVDPEAADIVFKSGAALTAIGLDVTADPTATLTPEHHRLIKNSRSPTTEFFTAITRQALERYGPFPLHDPTAVAYVLDPGLFTTKKYHVEVETAGSLTRGATVTDRRDWLPESCKQPSNASLCTSVDGKRLLSLLISRITKSI